MKLKTIAIGLIGGGLLIASPALADAIKVDATGYDVSVPSDLDALQRDILASASKICDAEAEDSEYRGLVTVGKIRYNCMADVSDAAVRNSGSEELIAFHFALSGEDRYDSSRKSGDALELAAVN